MRLHEMIMKLISSMVFLMSTSKALHRSILSNARFRIKSSVSLLQLRNHATAVPIVKEKLSKENDHNSTAASGVLKNFISNIIEDDLATNKHGGRVVTRFPPEPNGYLHLGHAKSINFNFGIASAYLGVTNMRFDDTNPAKEDMEYVLSILDDVRWLITGHTKTEPSPWHGSIRHASDYFQIIYDAAEYLIQHGLAYVDNLTAEQMREFRGTLTEPGKNSPYRDRSIEENLSLFRKMKAGLFQDGECILRAKIDMSSPNMNLRDPTLYRIKRASHPITKDAWCIYPMYDFAHAISDAMEEITHSLCTLEFADHRPLYDWTIDQLLPSGLLPQKTVLKTPKPSHDHHPNSSAESIAIPVSSPIAIIDRPYQYEFSRLNIQYTVLSKRKLIQLVTESHVHGWDDPRMPTISGMRRRGYPSTALKLFCDRIGISKAENNIDLLVLEECVREVLDNIAPRAFGILDPLKVTITNWPAAAGTGGGGEEVFTVPNHPKHPEMGNKEITFSKELFISRDDFFDTKADLADQVPLTPPKGYKRLLPNGSARLKFAYVITCQEVIRDPVTQEVIELRCSYDPETKSGANPAGMKKVKGIIHWLSQRHVLPVRCNLYDRLFVHPSPGSTQPDGDFLKDMNPSSLQVVNVAMVEDSFQKEKERREVGKTYQFERVGYFSVDPDTKDDQLVFNRVVTLKDTWENKA